MTRAVETTISPNHQPQCLSTHSMHGTVGVGWSVAMPSSCRPIELAVSAITMAELAAGPHATGPADERARRQDRLQGQKQRSIPFPSMEKRLAPMGGSTLPKSRADARARDTRALDLLIAATACAARLPIYTRNPEDFQSLQGLVDVVAV
jgi:predicted nucleic acid-binding protein